MREPTPSSCRRAAGLAVAALALAAFTGAASATRVAGAAAPAASSVLGGDQQPAHVQADESASLRQGTIGALDPRTGRVQVQGIWLDVVADKTQLLRGDRPAALDTLRVGESIRFTLLPGNAAAPALKVIYAP